MPLAREFHPYDLIYTKGEVLERSRAGDRITFRCSRGSLTCDAGDVVSGSINHRFSPPAPHFTPTDVEAAFRGLRP